MYLYLLYNNISARFWNFKTCDCEHFHLILVDSLMLAVFPQPKHVVPAVFVR
jgi:hypothetical protein